MLWRYHCGALREWAEVGETGSREMHFKAIEVTQARGGNSSGFERHLGGGIKKSWCLVGMMEGRKEEAPIQVLGLWVWVTGYQSLRWEHREDWIWRKGPGGCWICGSAAQER